MDDENLMPKERVQQVDQKDEKIAANFKINTTRILTQEKFVYGMN